MSRRTWTLIAVVLGSGIVFLDSTIVNVALRSIGEELPATLVGTLEGQSYVVNGYLLSLSALLILAGALADRYGLRRFFIIGLSGFGAASMACGLAPNMELLILARLAQGAFGALLVPTSLALINATFDGAARGRAFGIWAAATSALIVAGPVVGGFLIDTFDWRVAFLINVPLVAVGVAIAVGLVAESRKEDGAGSFDWIGAAVVALAVGGLSYGAIRGQERQWADPTAWAALAIGAVAAASLVPLMRSRPDPLVPPSLFRSRNFTVTNISTLLVYGALYTQGYFQAVFLQGTLGYSALASGLTNVPTGLALAFLSTTFGALAGRYGPRRFMAIGPALMAVGLLWFLRLPASSESWPAAIGNPASLVPPASFLIDVLPALVVFGAGIAMVVAPLTTALMTSVPVGNSGLASAINNAISRIGPLLATSVIFIAVSTAFFASLEGRTPNLDASSPEVREQVSPLNAPHPAADAELKEGARSASTDAFHLAMLIGALLCASGAAVNWVGIQDSKAGPGDRDAAAPGAGAA